LLDNSNKLTDDETTVAEIFNDYFVNVASKLDIETSDSCHTQITENDSDLLCNPSVKHIAESISADKSFLFKVGSI